MFILLTNKHFEQKMMDFPTDQRQDSFPTWLWVEGITSWKWAELDWQTASGRS